MPLLLADRFLLHTPLKEVTMRARLEEKGIVMRMKRKGKDGTGNGMLILPALTTQHKALPCLPLLFHINQCYAMKSV